MISKRTECRPNLWYKVEKHKEHLCISNKKVPTCPHDHCVKTSEETKSVSYIFH